MVPNDISLIGDDCLWCPMISWFELILPHLSFSLSCIFFCLPSLQIIHISFHPSMQGSLCFFVYLNERRVEIMS